MNNRIKTECARINCLRMLILLIASVSFSELLCDSDVSLVLSVLGKGREEKKEKKTKMAKAS